MESTNQIENDGLIKSLEDIIYLIDENYLLVNIWTSDENKLIIPKKELINRDIISVYGEDFGRKFCDLIDLTISSKNTQKLEFQRSYGPGKGRWYKAKFNYVAQKETEKEMISMVVREIHEEKLVSDKYKLFENIISNNWDAIMFANMNGNVEYANNAANQLYGYLGNELIGQNVDIFNSNDSPTSNDILKELSTKGQWYGELTQKKKDNSTFDALLSVQIISDQNGTPIGFFSNSKNITEDIETAKNLKKIIEEKEILLKELHHRVKNNLSIIKGILNIQGSQSENEIEINLINDFQNRVGAIATLHDTLFASQELDFIEFGTFIKELCRNTAQTFNNPDKETEISIDTDKFVISFADAVPLGLIVNEVLTNSYKHAFNDLEKGTINISLKSMKEKATILINDNGPGFDFEKEKLSSLGISLIEGLVEQVEGMFTFRNNSGAEFELVLPSQS